VSFIFRHPDDNRVHHSFAKAMAISPRHARYALEHPKDPTPAMRRGTAVDRLVLGGRLVRCGMDRNSKAWAALTLMAAGNDVAVYDGAVRNGGKWDSFEEANAGKPIVLQKEWDAAYSVLKGDRCDLGCIVTDDEYEAANGAATSVMTDPAAKERLEGEKQRVIHWDMFGLPWGAGIAGVRGGFDILGATWLADLKVTDCTEPIRWSKQARRMLYPQQLAAYRAGARFIGRTIDSAHLIGVEFRPPYVVTVLDFEPEDLDDAERDVAAWCERIRQCEASGNWPGYVQTSVRIEPKGIWEAADDAVEETTA
jgi:hypothetical protein